MKALDKAFYLRDAETVAQELVGKVLLRIIDGIEVGGTIVEVEAYGGADDGASHAHRGKTVRNQAMFMEGGHAYVYFIYGNHYCLNVVTGGEGQGEAVLIRAIEPEFGREEMRKRRHVKSDLALTNGPGKLCQSLGITGSFNGALLDGSAGMAILSPEDTRSFNVIRAPRVGISVAKDLPLRFYDASSPSVSRR